MPRITILQIGTRGVDMKTNPLLLDDKKLHAATNLIFDEGVIKTRPGFRYTETGAVGQFQGACEFSPFRGISSRVLTDDQGGLVIAAGGKLWLNGEEISGELFNGLGSVHIYQAENYLIVQNPSTPTYWWDGSILTASPGMQEQDWNDPETPAYHAD